MPKRGQKATHRVRYVHDNGIKGSIPAYSLEEAFFAARAPVSVEGCTVTIETIPGGAIATYSDPETFEAAIEELITRPAGASVTSSPPTAAVPVTDARRGRGRPAISDPSRPVRQNRTRPDQDAYIAAYAARDGLDEAAVVRQMLDEAHAAREETP